MNKGTYRQQLAQEQTRTLAILTRLEQVSAEDIAQEDQKCERLQRKLQRINAALKRLTTDRYGKCLACQTTIAPERLHALPYAEYCFPCQREIENEPTQTALPNTLSRDRDLTGKNTCQVGRPG